MYHCHIQFYLVCSSCKAYEIIKEMSPLENFTHEFIESDKPDGAFAAKANVIFVHLADRDTEGRETLQALLDAKGRESELILLAGSEQISRVEDLLMEVKELWTMPMSESEIKFRFLRWQESCKRDKDYWQTSQYLEATINHIPNLIWYKDKNGIHEKVNDSFCDTVNKTKEQVQGRGHAYIWDVEHDDPACVESEREVMHKKATCISGEVIQTRDGTRMLTTYKSPLFDIDGSVMGTVGVAVDVTKEHAYEQEILKKNRIMDTIFTTLDCGVISHSVDGTRILSINRAALKILGYESKEEFEKSGFHMVAASVMEEDKAKILENIAQLEVPGDSIGLEYRVHHKDGTVLHVMGNVMLLEENGEMFYRRFLLDCTAQRLEEEKSRRHQIELVQALCIDYNLVCSFELDTGIGEVLQSDDDNPPELNGIFKGELSLEECMGQYIRKFVIADDREMMYEAVSISKLKEELEGKKMFSINYRTVKEGEIKYFQMKAVRTGIWGEHHGIVMGFHSVDEEIRSEMEKKSLLEDALMQANRASKAKSVFLSNMSHDIRTPMNAIVGFTALAIAHIDRREQVEEYLGKIMTSGNHLLSLINDVLDMSRIESGKIRLEEKPCSLPDILHGLRNILQADVNAKQLELYIDTVDVLDEEIYCDKLRLNQVLLNLLSNSVKYTGPGGIISMRITEKAGGSKEYANYEFYIRDTGIGMSEEFVEHIFEPFEREENTTISKIQGTGLGMAITKNIVDMMNGTITVKSEQGVGTEFIVTFTFRLHAEKREPQDIPELKGSRALVVDDDFNTCDSVSYMLGQIGMRAEWTLSGKEAVLRTRQANMRGDIYSVYIIDWLLPDMNGIEVTRRIRKEMGEDVPIIILTAYDWFDIEEEAKEAGVSAFCAKPLFLSDLRNCLNSVIKVEEVAQEDTKEVMPLVHTGRILLAEDVELNQEIAVAILGDAGFDTEVAENGQIAVDMLQKSEPGYYQLILMDIQMPVLNGYEATKKIRKLENKELASIPIIAMSANAFEEDKQEALKCGMDGHIAKPIDVPALFETLNAVLG